MAAVTYTGGTPASGNQQQVLNQAVGTTSGNQATSGSEASSGSKTSTTQSNQTQAQSVNMANMTPEQLAMLNQLITQLSDHPTVSREQAAMILAKQGINAPQRPAFQNTTPVDVYGLNPANGGQNAAQNEYLKANQIYEARISEIQQQGGITQGGTAETNQQNKASLAEQETIRKAREGYEKEDAFADASLLQSRAMRQMLEQLLPSLNQAIESSGTSGGATAMLLKNDAAARSAESAAALGLDAAVKYGGIFDEQSKILEGLIQNNTPVLTALLGALGIAKGSVSQGSTVSSTSGNQTTNESSQASGTKTGGVATTGSEKKAALITPQNTQTNMYGNPNATSLLDRFVQIG